MNKEYLTISTNSDTLALHLTELAQDKWEFEGFVPLKEQGFMVKVLLSRGTITASAE